MPGFLMFDEFGLSGTEVDAMGKTGTGLVKAGLRMLPFSWLMHGIVGEFNVDIDPFEELRQLTQGRGELIRAASNPMEFSKAYQAWLSVTNLHHSIEGVGKKDRRQTKKNRDAVTREARKSAANIQGYHSQVQSGRYSPEALEAQVRANENKPGLRGDDEDDDAKQDHGEVTVEIEVDVSLPQLIKATLPQTGEDGADASKPTSPGKQFDIAEVHMCTTAQIDASKLTLGMNNPAASLIKTLVEAFIFNIIPYFSISMRNVTIEKIDMNLQGEMSTPPVVSLDLSFEKATYTYYMINGSNMNMFNLSTEFNYKDRKDPATMEWSLGSLMNPFG
jgi:type VI protein secretion system component Hcp